MLENHANARLPIGVFDSGVGGLTVVRALRKAIPGESILYLGDTARVPYGSKSAETVIKYTMACARFLISRGIKLLIVACNTASAYALDELAAQVSLPVIGAIEPGARQALRATKNGHIGVIGTLGTTRSEAYTVALGRLSKQVKVTGQACPLLVPLAEEGWADDDITHTIAVRYLRELVVRDADIDTIVLGCTHYPLLAPVIGRAADDVFGRPIALVDSAQAMAITALETLSQEGVLAPSSARGALHLFVTDATRMEELALRFLGEALTSFKLVDLQ